MWKKYSLGPRAFVSFLLNNRGYVQQQWQILRFPWIEQDSTTALTLGKGKLHLNNPKTEGRNKLELCALLYFLLNNQVCMGILSSWALQCITLWFRSEKRGEILRSMEWVALKDSVYSEVPTQFSRCFVGNKNAKLRIAWPEGMQIFSTTISPVQCAFFSGECSCWKNPAKRSGFCYWFKEQCSPWVPKPLLICRTK